MKKLVLFFAAVVAVAFASCGAKETTEEATEEVAVEEVAPVVKKPKRKYYSKPKATVVKK